MSTLRGTQTWAEPKMQPERLRTRSTTNMADCWRENFVGMAIPRCEILPPVLLIKAMLLAFQNFIRRRERARKVRLQRLKSASLKRILRYRRVQHRRTKTIVNSVLLHCMKPSPERKVWCEVRSESWWEDIVKRQFNDNDWVKNFRMSRDTFEDLCKEVSPYL